MDSWPQCKTSPTTVVKRLAEGHQIAVMYLSVVFGAGLAFVMCSFWVYHYVDVNFEAADLDDIDDDDEGNAQGSIESTSYGGLIPFVKHSPTTAHHRT